MCEFDWALDTYDPYNAIADTVVDTQYRSLEESFCTRDAATFSIDIKLRASKPRSELCDFGNIDIEDMLARRFKRNVFEEQ